MEIFAITKMAVARKNYLPATAPPSSYIWLYRLHFSESRGKQEHSENPVDEHGVPYPKHVFTQKVHKQVRESYAENKHRSDGHRHGKDRLAAGAEIIGQYKGDGPDDHRQRMGQNQPLREIRGLR